jgi:hypothetical protein
MFIIKISSKQFLCTTYEEKELNLGYNYEYVNMIANVHHYFKFLEYSNAEVHDRFQFFQETTAMVLKVWSVDT